MRHRSKKVTLDRLSAPRDLLLRNLAASIIMYERVKTTSAKAKAVRPMVERAITTAKANTPASVRRLTALLPQKLAVKKLTEVLRERYTDRTSGYTRTVKIGSRQGDGAQMVQIELV
jgi:large subunit ribosomal protein L17